MGPLQSMLESRLLKSGLDRFWLQARIVVAMLPGTVPPPREGRHEMSDDSGYQQVPPPPPAPGMPPAPSPYGQYPPQPGYPAAPPAADKSGLAVTSLVLGIVSLTIGLCLAFIPGSPARQPSSRASWPSRAQSGAWPSRVSCSVSWVPSGVS